MDIEFTILMPCLNEAETLAVCIEKAKKFLMTYRISGEILIADNGSTDGSQQIAYDLGARVVSVPERGYGAALIGGCDAALGKYVIMGDADNSYDFTDLMPFVERLRAGDDLVMGNRFKGGIKKGAMPTLHRYLGNPVLSGIGRLFFKCPIRDFHCGLRGYNTQRIRELNLHTAGMEYASEMVVQAQINGYKISEVPTTLSPDGRSRPPHLRSWRDGWRHLKFLLMYCPNWLFLYPGAALVLIGLFFGTIIEISSLNVFGAMLDINTLLYCAVMVFVGFNLISFHVYVKIYAKNVKFIKLEKTFAERLNANNCTSTGMFVAFIGIIITVAALLLWRREGFGGLNPEKFMRITIPAATLISVGIQLIFSGFFIDILKIKVKTLHPNQGDCYI
jgi:glycosyltransferase involved in cell wall biosynthesis